MGERVGVSCLMSAVTLSHGLRIVDARRGVRLVCPSPAFPQLLGFNDTDEVKCRNAYLSH